MRNIIYNLLIEVTNMNTAINQLKVMKEEKEELESKVELITDADKLTKLAKSYKIESRKQFILNVINQALHVVFTDNYKIDIIIDESKTSTRYNIVYKLVLFKNNVEIASNADLYTTTGGGVITIISFIMKIILGYINTGNKFFILDEVFSQVSEKYRPGIARLLRILCDKYDFTFFIISHDKLEQEDVDVVYHASLGFDEDNIPLLNIKREYSKYKFDKDYYAVEIENFQSIKKETIFIKGVTVVYGDSDSGKSAIQRAISSIILNDFIPKSYPRWRKKGSKKINTRIKFIKDTNSNKEFIELNYKDVVKYNTHTGEEFTGKKLASENINTILESFGFAKINTNNLTNDLKEQVSRIYITTQYDKLFLPEERNGVEKILTILFESQIYNDVSSMINGEILEINKSLKDIHYKYDELSQYVIKQKIKVLKLSRDSVIKVSEITDSLQQYRDTISKIDDKIVNIKEVIYNLEKIKQIAILSDVKLSLNLKKIKLYDLDDKVKLVNDIISKYNVIKLVDGVQETKESITNHVNKLDTINNKLQVANDLILLTKVKKQYSLKNKMQKSNDNIKVVQLSIIRETINNYEYMKNRKVELTTKLNNITNTISNINDVINDMNKLQDIKNNVLIVIDKMDKLEKYKDKLSQINDSIGKLPDEIGIHICPTCNGNGYV